MYGSLVEQYKIVRGCTATAMNATVTLDNVSLKNVNKAWIVIQLSNATGKAVVINPLLGTSVATCATAITFSAKYWSNADTSSTDTLVANTAGTTLTVSSAATPAMHVVEIDPAAVAAQGATYDCLGCTITGGSNAGDYASAIYVLEMRYPQATPPAAITD